MNIITIGSDLANNPYIGVNKVGKAVLVKPRIQRKALLESIA